MSGIIYEQLGGSCTTNSNTKGKGWIGRKNVDKRFRIKKLLFIKFKIKKKNDPRYEVFVYIMMRLMILAQLL